MAEIYYIGDTHFYHSNIIGFDGRPWENVEEMNQGLIDNWNKQVTGKDWVYILGDFAWSNKPEKWAEILKQLKGNKILITGNHDPSINTNLDFYKNLQKLCGDRGFKGIREGVKIKDGDYTAILSHYYMANYEHAYDPFNYMLYAHSHVTKEADLLDKLTYIIRQNKTERYDNRGQLISVSCCRPYMNYTPQTLDYLIDEGLFYFEKVEGLKY